jgi:hypothetical protein
MNWFGGGLIIIIHYGTGSGLSVQNALLTESGDEILAENSDYLQYEP